MAKTQIKPKYFTDEEGEWKALIGKNIFCFSYNKWQETGWLCQLEFWNNSSFIWQLCLGFLPL